MKKHLLSLTIICIYSYNLFPQSSTWTKDDRNNLYDDCLSYLTKYKNTTQEQRESVALCYLDEITNKYVKTDFQAKIDIEVKRIKDGVITGCAKNLGVALDVPLTPEKVSETKAPSDASKVNPTMELLTGRWKTDNGSTIEFKDGGKYSEINLKGKQLSGDWFLDGKVLTISIQEAYTQLITRAEKTTHTTSKYDFESFSKDFIKYTRAGVSITIQANRIK